MKAPPVTGLSIPVNSRKRRFVPERRLSALYAVIPGLRQAAHPGMTKVMVNTQKSYRAGFGGADNCSVRSRSVRSTTVYIGAVSS